jgi:hypothetical protein
MVMASSVGLLTKCKNPRDPCAEWERILTQVPTRYSVPFTPLLRSLDSLARSGSKARACYMPSASPRTARTHGQSPTLIATCDQGRSNLKELDRNHAYSAAIIAAYILNYVSTTCFCRYQKFMHTYGMLFYLT